MKIAMVTDIHFGCFKNSEIFLNSSAEFLEKQFIPMCIDNKVERVIIPGDVFDNRTMLNVNTINVAKKSIRKIAENFPVIIIAGNHDLYFTTTHEVHSLEIFADIKNVTIVDSDIKRIKFGDKNFVLVPWVINKELFVTEMSKGGDVLIGHLDISGFSMNNSTVSEHGHDINIFNKFKKVFSGHFHTYNSKIVGNTEIIYIGSMHQSNRGDVGDERGFVVLDTESLKYEFLANTVSPKFEKLTYPEKFKCNRIKGNFVDVHIEYTSDSDDKKIEKYLETIDGCLPVEKPKVHFVSKDRIEDRVALNIDSVSSMDKLFVEYVGLQSDELKSKDAVLAKLLSVYNIVSGLAPDELKGN